MEREDGGLGRVLLGGAGLLAMVAIVAVIIKIDHREFLSKQANTFAQTFINNSPVVQRHLGAVENIRKVEELHETGKAPGWLVEDDATGRRGSGVVQLRLTQKSNFDQWDAPVQWHVALADLDIGKKVVQLR